VSGVLGLLCAFAMWGWGPVATISALMVPVFAVSMLTGARGIARSTGIAVRVSVAVVGAGGFLVAFGWSGAAWLVFLVATSPFARILLLSRQLRISPGSPLRWDPTQWYGENEPADEDPGLLPFPGAGGLKTRVVLTELPDADGLTALDDQEICVAWRRSYLQLEEPVPTGRRLEVVRLRQLYLDELSRRHPAELRRWLASGARAAGNPLPFLERPARSPASGEQTEDGPRGT
jgi:hypothetical protein